MGEVYRGDSFFTLSALGQVGLAGVSLVLAALMLLASRRLAERGWPALLVPGLFWLFEWLSPQVYYLYYQSIFEGLPWQIVVGPMPLPGDIVALMTFSGPATLSAHGRGVLYWAMAAMAVWVLFRRRRSRHSR
ncbi:MAG: hypothetical protein AAFR17_18580 [Pseudomonadota bacterium]